jgi:acetolactate synthase-1/2/3 large subunit
MLGMHGTFEANNAMHYADVILAVGARFDDRVIGNPEHFGEEKRRVIHIDIDPSSISKRVKVDVPIVGNIVDVLDEMLKLLDGNFKTDPDLRIGGSRSTNGAAATHCATSRPNHIMPQFVIEKLYEVTGGDAFITSDVGQHQMFAAQYYKFDKPRRWINSGGSGHHGRRPAVRHGRSDGQSGGASRLRHGRGFDPDVYSGIVDVQAVWLADQDHQPEQRHAGHGPPVAGDVLFQRYSESYVTSLPDFVKLAEAYGHVGMKIEKPEDVEPALRKAFTEHKNDLVFMDFIIDPVANVFPMVSAGKGLTEMILAEDL